jgi:hypothetical protein
MATQFVGNLTTSGDVNTPLSIASILAAAGFPFGGLVELIIQPTGAGNLVMSSDSAIDAEADGFLLAPTLSFPTLTMRGTQQSPIQTAEIYLLSATASKTFSVIATSVA